MNDIEKALETIIVNNNSYDTKENVSKETIEKIFASHIGFKREKDKFVDYVYLYDNSGGNFYPVREVVCYAGAPGTGKTSFVNTLAEATGRKLETISCAGWKKFEDYSILGDESKPSLVAWAIERQKCKNPIILLDELEKVADEKIQADLITLFEMYNNKGKDKSQIFHDKCYDKDIELDHITFFANVNYPEQLAPLLKNKIRMRRLESLSREEKKEILKIKKKEIVGSLQKIYPHENPTAVESLISEEFINQLVDYIQESGVRQSVRVLYKLEKDYINAKENGQEFSLGDPKQWLKNNVLAYRETFQPGKRHYFLFGLWGIAWILAVIVIAKKIILRNENSKKDILKNN